VVPHGIEDSLPYNRRVRLTEVRISDFLLHSSTNSSGYSKYSVYSIAALLTETKKFCQQLQYLCSKSWNDMLHTKN